MLKFIPIRVTAIGANRARNSLVDSSFDGIHVGVFFTEKYFFEKGMLPEEFPDSGCPMVRRPVDKKDDLLDLAPLRIIDEMRKMSSKFNISPAIKAVPDNSLPRPKVRDTEPVKAHSLRLRRAPRAPQGEHAIRC